MTLDYNIQIREDSEFESYMRCQLQMFEVALRLRHVYDELGLKRYVTNDEVIEALNSGTFDDVMIVKKSE